MCVIIELQAFTPIDKQNIETAILNNPDGYGIVAPNMDGTCEMIKGLDCDADSIMTLLDEFNQSPVMLHLRYNTAGATNRRNLHPFPILEFEKDGVDLWMAHNGTLTDWEHPYRSTDDYAAWESDTRNFVRNFVRPLFKRLIKGMDIEDILSDPWVYEVLERELTAKSVLSFMDGFGNSLQVNPLGNGGSYTGGVWVSNTYSFNPEHRKPYKPTTWDKERQSPSYRGAEYWDDYDQWYEQGKNSSSLTKKPDPEPIKEDPIVLTPPAPKANRTPYTTMTGLERDDIFMVTDDQVKWLAAEGEIETLWALVEELKNRAFDAELELIGVKDKKSKAEKMIATLKAEAQLDRGTSNNLLDFNPNKERNVA